GVTEKGGSNEWNGPAGRDDHGKKPKERRKGAGFLVEDEVEQHRGIGGVRGKTRRVGKNVDPANRRLLGPRSTALPARRKSRRVEQPPEEREHVDLRNPYSRSSQPS